MYSHIGVDMDVDIDRDTDTNTLHRSKEPLWISPDPMLLILLALHVPDGALPNVKRRRKKESPRGSVSVSEHVALRSP